MEKLARPMIRNWVTIWENILNAFSAPKMMFLETKTSLINAHQNTQT